MSAAAVAVAYREAREALPGGQEGTGSCCSKDQARWAGKLDQAGTIPEEGIPCQIRQDQEDQDQVGPSLVEAGKGETCWGFEIQARQEGREDHWGQEVD